jgi:hypothetical protein
MRKIAVVSVTGCAIDPSLIAEANAKLAEAGHDVEVVDATDMTFDHHRIAIVDDDTNRINQAMMERIERFQPFTCDRDMEPEYRASPYPNSGHFCPRGRQRKRKK